MAARGHSIMSTAPVAEKITCGTDPLWLCCGFVAMSMPLTPPKISMTRPASAAGRSASPVATWQAPTPSRALVISQR